LILFFGEYSNQKHREQMPNFRKIICLPVAGLPYIIEDKTTKLEDLQEVVGGYIEHISNRLFTIHPTFTTETGLAGWDAIKVLIDVLRKNQYDLYCNDDPTGLTNNMACIINDCWGVRPLKGNLVLVIKNKYTWDVLNKNGDGVLPILLETKPFEN
jgi:hypothetical protein